MFTSALVGGLVDLLVGWLTRFNYGLATGLLIFGGTTMWFAVRCLQEYQLYSTAGERAVWGEVIAVENRPVNASGSITEPVPVVRFAAPDDTTHTVRGRAATGARVGQHMNVVYDAGDPQRSRIGFATDYRGGAIAFMLFGTFPLSFAVIMIHGAIDERVRTVPVPVGGKPERSAAQQRIAGRVAATGPRDADSGRAAVPARGEEPPPKQATWAFVLAMLCAILWIAIGTGELE